MNLQALGWNKQLQTAFNSLERADWLPARVIQHHRDRYIIAAVDFESGAQVSGKYRHRTESKADFPAVGDWVAVSRADGDRGEATIHALLPRRSAFGRKVAGEVTEEQVMAANIDLAFLVNGLDGDFNVRRIERYVTAVWDSGATPIVLLNKADLCDDIEAVIEQVNEVAFGVDVLPLSAADGTGVAEVAAVIAAGRTAVFLGSSGVGKSTLINRLLGYERQATQEVRESDSRGRHTTTLRELILLPSGGCVIDTPGLRLLKLWIDPSSLDQSFSDIDELAEQCRFRDCTHAHEPGCAVQEALQDGTLDRKRFGNYLKLKREMRYLERRQDARAHQADVAKWRKITQAFRQRKKFDGKYKT